MEHELITGRITKATAGFYYVTDKQGQELSCRARGVFRKDGVTPLVGDLVRAQRNEDGSGTVAEILPRTNSTVRPPLANLDLMVVVLSVVDPAPNLLVVDKFLALLEKAEIEPLIAVTKTDLAEQRVVEDLAALYRGAGYPVYVLSNETGEGVSALADALAGKFCAFSGNSGVGKSSLLNTLDPSFALAVGDTSKKLGRGKHTTRHVELFKLQNGALVADTPGFSSMSLSEMGGVDKEELAGCFREFAQYAEQCRFRDCAHVAEKDCAVLQAVAQGKIDPRRHQSYRQLYDEVKDIKAWEQR